MQNQEWMIQASHLKKKYDKNLVLEDVSFSIPAKGIHGILGPKGAGKSTLMDLLAACETANEGEILLQGATVAEQKEKIGYVPEFPDFYARMTVLETLDFVGEIRGVSTDKRYRQIKEATELMGLESIQNRLIGRLTQEEIKKVALAAALLGNPEVVLIDEPLWGTTAVKQRDNEQLLRMLGKHKTVVIASENFSMIRHLCEDVLILSEGSVIAQDTFEGLEEKLLRKEGAPSLEAVYESLLELSRQACMEESSSALFKKDQSGKESNV